METWERTFQTSNMKRRLILADHRTLLRCGIRTLLERIPGLEIVAEMDNGADLAERVVHLQPDALLLAPDLEGLNGREVARRIQRCAPSTRTLMVSDEAEPALVARALAAGAQGYLLTRDHPEELSNALARLFRRRSYLSPGIDRWSVERLQACPSHDACRLDLISPRQRQTLQLICEGLGTQEIAALLKLSPKTVETHRAQLKRRLGIDSVAGLVRFAIASGLVNPNSGTKAA